MDIYEFRNYAHELVDWISDYFENIEQYPVKSDVKPSQVIRQLPLSPPEDGEAFDFIFKDFQNIILPGITHWQHPSFFGYFPANSSFPSLLGEILTAALGTQCMSWQTSPAATELEERVMEWMAQLLGLPEIFTGVIEDTALTATLCSLLSAREKISGFSANRVGLYDKKRYTVYCSSEAHVSIDKGVKIAGLGEENLRKIDVDDHYAMIPEKLEETVVQDRHRGFIPLAVVAAFGTSGSTAIDPIEWIGNFCNEQSIWLHIDAAYAGTALVLPEKRELIKGIEMADTFVFNPHKWMFTNFDCSAYFVKDKETLNRTLAILPEYLKTNENDSVKNYRDWGIQLGRRFRALKLWFMIRSFGVTGIREKITKHIKWAQSLSREIEASNEFELMAPVPFSALCFRFKPKGVTDFEELNIINKTLMETLNNSGRLYLTHANLKGNYILRLVVGQTYVEKRHVDRAWEQIKQTAEKLKLSKRS